MEKRHPHFTDIFSKMTSFFGFLLIIALDSLSSVAEAVSSVSPGETATVTLIVAGAILFLLLIAFFFAYLGWRNTWISIKDDTLYYEKGVIFKKKTSIPFSKINTIDTGRNIFNRIFGTSKLKFDTGAMIGQAKTGAEMNLIFSVAETEQIKRFILTRNAADADAAEETNSSMPKSQRAGGTVEDKGEPAWFVRASFRDFLLYGLTSSGVFKLFILLIAGAVFAGELLPGILDSAVGYAGSWIEIVNDFVVRYNIFVVILLFVALLAVFFVINSIYGVLVAAIRFYNFRVARDGRNIVIKYGIISLKSYTLPVATIHAVKIKQNLIQQIFRQCSIEVVSMGYGDENKELKLLFPIVSKSYVAGMIAQLLPEYVVQCDYVKTTKSGILHHIVFPIIRWAVVLGVIYAMLSAIFETMHLTAAVMILIMVLVAVNAVLRYRHTALGYSGKAIAVREGGMNYTETLIRVDSMQSIIEKNGPIQRAVGVSSYVVRCHAPFTQSLALAKSLPKGEMGNAAKCIDIVI
ncbi:MAG: PH domain-containing protein [Oscillospiraceae bacterium]|nr:PH domain-containing protein [Oscillospiraceae bacterium]